MNINDYSTLYGAWRPTQRQENVAANFLSTTPAGKKVDSDILLLPTTCRSYTRGERRRDNRRDDRPVYTLQAIVAATIASWLLD